MVRCEVCVVTIFEARNIFPDRETCLEFLRNHGAILDCVDCPRCKRPCLLSEGDVWRCQKRFQGKRCYTKISNFSNTIFSMSRLPIETICIFITYYLLIPPPHQENLTFELNLSSTTVVRWSKAIRKVMIAWGKACSADKIGGLNHVVEVDETCLSSRKFNRGRMLHQTWVLGGLDRITNHMFLQVVETRDHITLSTHLHDKIELGSTIITDGWKGYEGLAGEGYSHLTVNHSRNFVNPRNGANTQRIERSWRTFKRSIPLFGRISVDKLEYFAEFLFRKRYDNYKERVHYFFSFINLYFK